MEKYLNLDTAFQQKPEVTNVAQELRKYLKQWILANNPDSKSYDEMYDFVQEKTSKLYGASYFPLSKFERRFASKLYDVLHLENIIHKRITESQKSWAEPNIANRSHKLYTTRKELFEIILSSICISKESEKKVLNTFSPDELVLLCDFFEEETVENITQDGDEQRTQELAAWISDDNDETDVAATFYDRVVQHHEINNPLGTLVKDMLYNRWITYARLYRKLIQNTQLMRWYFWRYPHIFVVSYCEVLTYEQMNNAMQKIFPKHYCLPDMKSYIDRWYDREKPDQQYDDD